MGAVLTGAERRRSDRILLTIPLKVHGKDPKGADFSEAARTVSLNRHGARILIGRPLQPGDVLRITNQVGRREAEFRVVGPLAPPTKEGSEWGVECLNLKQEIWGIKFPPAGTEGGGGNALLECRNCHSVALAPVSLVEVDVLDTSGIIPRTCETCATSTPWGYAEKQVMLGAPAEERGMMAEAQAQIEEAAANRRQHRRICLQLPVMIRDYYGNVEISKTENVSKGGFCCASERDYLVGQGLLVICPYDKTGQNIEVRARVVRRHEPKGSSRKLYGVRYDQKAG